MKTPEQFVGEANGLIRDTTLESGEYLEAFLVYYREVELQADWHLKKTVSLMRTLSMVMIAKGSEDRAFDYMLSVVDGVPRIHLPGRKGRSIEPDEYLVFRRGGGIVAGWGRETDGRVFLDKDEMLDRIKEGFKFD